MIKEDESIQFEGTDEHLACLRRFVAEVRKVKVESGIIVEDEELADSNRWLDILSEKTVAHFIENDVPIEDIVYRLLLGEYELDGVIFKDGKGALLYNPLAFPFGGTDTLKETVEAFGFKVVGDSFHDGFKKWKGEQGSSHNGGKRPSLLKRLFGKEPQA